jgi:hypothetical protein
MPKMIRRTKAIHHREISAKECGQCAEKKQVRYDGIGNEANEIVLGIFVVRILGILRGWREQSRDMALVLLAVGQSVVVLEVVTALGSGG